MPGKLQLTVAEPCHENWERMTPTGQGRFCGSCQKTVTDFSMMSDKEILNHLSHRDNNICGRFMNDQLDRPLRPELKKKYSWAYVWNLLIATFLTATSAAAQSKNTNPRELTAINKRIKDKEPAIQRKLMGDTIFRKPTSIKGVILDNKTNQPISFASISNINGVASGVAADSNGVFSIAVSAQKEIVLSISAIGYESQEFAVAPGSNKLNFFLDPVEWTLEPIVITAYPTIRCSVKLGGVSMRTSVIRTEKLKRHVADLTPELFKKREVKLFPNPVSPGSTLTLALSLKNPGDYTTEILDASGRIVYRGQISMQSKVQNISIATSSAWNKGIYWVRVMGKDSKQTYHSKLVLQ